MKLTKYFPLFLLVLTLILSSCGKEESAISKKELLTANSWRIISSSSNGLLDKREDCLKDDILTFFVDGKYTIDPEAIKCSPIDKIEIGTWTLSGDEKNLTINGEDIMTIIELTKSKLVISQIVGSNKVEMILTTI
jgi:hypothetical protein